MRGSKSRPGRRVWSFFLSAAACLAPGAALAQCIVSPLPSPGNVPCFITVQPIDVCSSATSCSPFNTAFVNGNPSTAGKDSTGNFNNSASTNPIGFVVDPATGKQNPGTSAGVDVTRALLNEMGVDVTWLPMAQYISPNNVTVAGNYQTLNVFQPVGTTILQSTEFLTLSFQKQISQGVPTFPPPPGATFGTNPNPPNQPLGFPSNVVNMFFVNTLTPPSPGVLYGFSWICNNGVAIARGTFGFPLSRTSPPPRPDTIAHELGHNLCLDHPIFGAGPYNPFNAQTNPQGGVVPAIPSNPLIGECDPSYPACALNLMSAGNLRTEPTVGCVLAPNPPLSTNPCRSPTGAPLPTLSNGLTDQVTFPSSALSTQLPVSQQAQVLAPPPQPGTPGSGLLSRNTTLGFLNPIPLETTKAQLAAGGRSPDPILFDLSGPAGGKPGETLVAWVLTLPQEQTFARHGRFHIISQSRKDLVQDVDYYPDAENNPLKRNIAYSPGANNNPDDPSVGTAARSPCTSATAECLIVKFQPPGLGANDSISFSKGILGGDTPITNDDLCKAKITYIFSDRYSTTSNFRPCPAASLPLISSSWRPDPTVAPQIVKTNVLLVQGSPPPCTPIPGTDTTPGCLDPTVTGLSDADPRFEGGQPGQSCNNGEVNGKIQGDVTVSATQSCVFTNPCEIKGNLTINGGTVYLACAVDGNIIENGGLLKLDASANVGGNVLIGGPQVSQASAFTLAPGALIGGNLVIQNVPGSQQGTVCGTQVKENLVVQNNMSPIEIGVAPGTQNCAGNTIGGNLQCTGNTTGNSGLTGGKNVVKGTAQGQCAMGFKQ
jgi:hypothetical protein